MASGDRGANAVGQNKRPTMLARIGVMRALNRGQVREFREAGKHHWGRPNCVLFREHLENGEAKSPAQEGAPS
jgi:hypothetical protein